MKVTREGIRKKCAELFLTPPREKSKLSARRWKQEKDQRYRRGPTGRGDGHRGGKVVKEDENEEKEEDEEEEEKEKRGNSAQEKERRSPIWL